MLFVGSFPTLSERLGHSKRGSSGTATMCSVQSAPPGRTSGVNTEEIDKRRISGAYAVVAK